MAVVKVSENYGVAGPDNELSVTTTTLLSCSAIIFYRTATRMLGVFHYGSMTISSVTVQNMILQMMNDLAPDEIVLWPANIVDHGYGGEHVAVERIAVGLDNAKVRQFLLNSKAPGATVTQIAGQTFAGVSANGALQFGVSSDGTLLSGINAGRSQVGNLRYYYTGHYNDTNGFGSRINDTAREIYILQRG